MLSEYVHIACVPGNRCHLCSFARHRKPCIIHSPCVHTTYLRVAENLKSEGVSAVFSGEREVAVAMTEHLMRDFGATDEQIDRERRKLRERMA